MRNVRGQGLVEYLILVALIAIAAIAVVSTVGKNIQEQYANVSGAIGNRSGRVSVSKPEKNEYSGRKMDNFKDEGGGSGNDDGGGSGNDSGGGSGGGRSRARRGQ